MADELVRQYGSWLLLFVFFGSLVDCLQFAWLWKRSWRKLKQRAYKRLAQEFGRKTGEEG